MRLLRPERAGMRFDEFIAYSCAPGIQALLTDVLCLDAEEMRVQQAIWRKYTRTRTPAAYPGFAALFASFRARGGRVSVISHSEREVILRHYRELFGFEPDLVFGWEQPEARRKPHPWPLEETLRAFGLRPEEALLVDDLSPRLCHGRRLRRALGLRRLVAHRPRGGKGRASARRPRLRQRGGAGGVFGGKLTAGGSPAKQKTANLPALSIAAGRFAVFSRVTAARRNAGRSPF